MEKFTKINSEKYTRTSSDAQVAQLGHLNYLISSIENGAVQSENALKSVKGTISPSQISTIINNGGGLGITVRNVEILPVVAGEYNVFSHGIVKITSAPTASGLTVYFGTPSIFGEVTWAAFVNIIGGNDEAEQGIYYAATTLSSRINNYQVGPFTPAPLAITFTSNLIPYVPLTTALEYKVFYYTVTI